jgi:hypothetical protein
MSIFAINIFPGSGFKGPGPLGGATPDDSGTVLNKVISTAIGVITTVAFIWFVIQFMIATIEWISSGGDAKKVSSAKDKLTNSIIGLVLTVSAIFLIEFVGRILGVELLDPAAILK